MTKSLKANVVYNILLTVSSYFISFITYPYITRVLGVNNIGVVSFVNKTIDIFVMVSMLGIPLVGIREIASHSNNEKELSKIFSNLLSLNIIFSLFILVFYLLSIFLISGFKDNFNYFLVGILKLISSTFLIEWFFQGIEKFKYITLRNILVKVLYVICIFVFVKDSTDTILYYLFTIGLVVVNGIINWVTASKYVSFTFTINHIKYLISPIILYGLYNILNSVFSTCNYTILGFVKNTTEVGYYSTAEQFYLLFLSVISAATKAILPRMSSLLSTENNAQFNFYVNTSLQLVFKLCLPLTIIGICMAENIVNIIAGNGYDGAVVPLKIMMFLVLVNGVNQVLINQAAIPLKYDKEIFWGVVLSAIVAVLLNFILFNKLDATFSSLIFVICVFIGNIYPDYKLLTYGKVKISPKPLFLEVLKSIPYVILTVLVRELLHFGYFQEFLIASLFCIIYFVIINYKVITKLLPVSRSTNRL